MRVLVTGGAGFIGSHIVDRYVAGGWDVTVLDDLSSGRRENLPPGVELLVGDLAGPGLEDLVGDREFDLVNHHAAQIDVRVSVRDPALDARVNLIGLLNLLELVRAQGEAPVVFASSGGVMYGEAEIVPTPEHAPKLPFSPYAVAKLASEYYLQYYSRVHGLRYVALRYGNVYGPRQNPEGEAGVVSIFCGKILSAEPLTVYGSGEQDRDFVYVADVAEANWLASLELTGDATRQGPAVVRHDVADPAEEPVDEPALNVGTGRATSVLDLVRVLGEIVGEELPVRYAAPRVGELLHSTLAPSKIERRLGWKARTSLSEGLTATYRHFSAIQGAST